MSKLLSLFLSVCVLSACICLCLSVYLCLSTCDEERGATCTHCMWWVTHYRTYFAFYFWFDWKAFGHPVFGDVVQRFWITSLIIGSHLWLSERKQQFLKKILPVFEWQCAGFNIQMFLILAWLYRACWLRSCGMWFWVSDCILVSPGYNRHGWLGVKN